MFFRVLDVSNVEARNRSEIVMARRLALILVGLAAICSAQYAAVNAEFEAGHKAAANGDLGAAEQHFELALARSKSVPDDAYRAVKGAILKELSQVYAKSNRLPEAETLLKDRVARWEKPGVEGDPDLGGALSDLEYFYITAHRLDDAAPFAGRAVRVFKECAEKRSQPKDQAKQCDWWMADAQSDMGFGFVLASQWANAEPWLRPVAERRDNEVRPEVMAATLNAYARVLWKKGDVELAKAVAFRWKQFTEEHPGAVALPPK
jgi:hypothetical protein